MYAVPCVRYPMYATSCTLPYIELLYPTMQGRVSVLKRCAQSKYALGFYEVYSLDPHA